MFLCIHHLWQAASKHFITFEKKNQTPNIYSLEEGSTRIQNVLE